MKKKCCELVLVLSVVILPLLLLSCSSSGSGGGDDPGPGAPSLSNLSFPSETYRGETCLVSCDYSDPEGDIIMLYSTDTHPGGIGTKSYTADELGITGTSGRITVLDDTNLSASYGTHHIEIWVEDAGHHTSNRLTHDLEVIRK